MFRPARLLVPIVITLALIPALSGCGSRSGCSKDTDCKGNRVCVDGSCVESSAGGAATPIQVKGLGPSSTPLTPQPPPQPPPPQSPPDTLAADGLPVDIPPPGSQPPTTAEWNAVPREIVVRGSSSLNCETKMLREWLRVSCHKSVRKGEPIEARHVRQSGQQVFQFVAPGVASIVTQVVRGKDYAAQFIWDKGGAHTGAELVVSWPSGAPRPQITLTEN
jgi:hypothetical protein